MTVQNSGDCVRKKEVYKYEHVVKLKEVQIHFANGACAG
jgi:hypothetical protein